MAIQNRNPDGTIKADYGDTPEKRYCPGCDRFYPTTNFYQDSRGLGGLTRRCKQCHSRKSYESRQKRPFHNGERYESMRKWTLLKKYNITPEEFQALLAKQKGKCKICGESSKLSWTNELNGGLHVDHHHVCGNIRGLLCSHCNTAIGLMGEDTEVLKKAIKYLRVNTCCANKKVST